MVWPSWQQAAVMALVCTVAGVVLRRVRPGRTRNGLLAAVNELALLAALYGVWRLARMLPLATETGAVERAHQIDRIQHLLHLPSELTLQRLLLRHGWAGWSLNTYYAVMHVPTLLVFLAWLFARHRDAYPRWRNGLVFVTACCLFIRFVRVAPPRLLTELGYVDIGEAFGWSIYGPVGTGASDQFAAMPSIHVAWAAVVSFGAYATAPRPWNRIALAHVVVTTVAVSATGYHWWLDGLVAIGLLALGLKLDDAVRRRRSRPVPANEALPVAGR
jgi:hypothetical protein